MERKRERKEEGKEREGESERGRERKRQKGWREREKERLQTSDGLLYFGHRPIYKPRTDTHTYTNTIHV